MTPIIKSFYDKGEEVSKARECILFADKEEEKKKISRQDSEEATAPTLPSSSSSFTSRLESSKELVPARSEPLQVTLLDTFGGMEDSAVNLANNAKDISLHAKMDTLLSELKSLKEQMSTKKTDQSLTSPLAAVDRKCQNEVAELMLKWPDAKNSIDLTNICEHLRFFGGDAEKGVLAVLRCETCYNFMMSKRPASLTANPVTVAKKGLGG